MAKVVTGEMKLYGMTYLLFQWSHWDYQYLKRELGEECWVVFSRDYSQRVLRYLSGVVKAFGWVERITAGSRLVITERCNHNIARL